jgi:NADH-quinone oxidoreductase subunit C
VSSDDAPGEASVAVGSAPPPSAQPNAQASAHPVIFCSRAEYHDAVAKLRDEGFELLSDLCGVDYLTHRGRELPSGVEPVRFEIAVVLTSVTQRRKVRVRVQIPEGDPVVDSLWDLYPGTEAMEREAFDMFGIAFSGHPDLTRILMPEDWEGYPLRKDYSVGRVPVQFKEAPGPR